MAREGPEPVRPAVGDPERWARLFWRRQLVLCAVAAGVVVAAMVVLALAVPGRPLPVSEIRLAADGGVEIARPADEAFRSLMLPVVAAALAVTTVLGGLVVHTIRVATFTFRRGDS